MANLTRLELFCRLFLGLFVGFFCVTAMLFVRDELPSSLPQGAAVQPKNATRALPGGAPAVRFSSVSPSQPAAPSPDAKEKVLIASSTSTLVTFIAAAVANFLGWRKGRQRRRSIR
ncbi:hypothetical protein [Burkholderia guangdongensis]|uniref:hypothetical protein n=1 Tax=Burkholderia guangdongensis TaxID=1792500 RepID=UPI0015C80834|nr:hypothetical protein [Burkholderia guangdongensis]